MAGAYLLYANGTHPKPYALRPTPYPLRPTPYALRPKPKPNQVRTYVNGTLYSVLVRASLKARAQELGLAEALDALIEQSDETFARQISYILEQLSAPPAEDGDQAQSGDALTLTLTPDPDPDPDADHSPWF